MLENEASPLQTSERLSPDTPFRDAALTWLQRHLFEPLGPLTCTLRKSHVYLQDRTVRGYLQTIRTLTFFFAVTPLKDIHPMLLREYQKRRAETVSPNKINQELGCLRQIMNYSGAWTAALEREYLPFRPEESAIPRALTPEEQEHFLKVAASSKHLLLIYCYSLIALNTACSSSEMRELRLDDVSRGDNMVYVRWGKNKYRTRSVRLAEDGQWAMKQLVERANVLGAYLPEHYLFPFRIAHNNFDPTRHLTDWGLVKPWNEVRDAAGYPWFHCNALRHTALTRYAEGGMPMEILRAYAGHITEKMTRHYLQIGDACKRLYLEGKRPSPQIKRPFLAPPFTFGSSDCSQANVDVAATPLATALAANPETPAETAVSTFISSNPTAFSYLAPLAVQHTWEIEKCVAVPENTNGLEEAVPTLLIASEEIPIKALTSDTVAAQQDQRGQAAANGVFQTTEIVPVWQLEREAILNALRRLQGKKPEAARLLGLSKTTLAVRIHEYKIRCCEWQHSCVHRHAPEQLSVDPSTWQGKRGRKGRKMARPPKPSTQRN